MKPSPPLVSVVVLSYNSKETLLSVVDQIKKQDYSYVEIIIVDNASEDGSSLAVEEMHPDISVIKLDRNIGIAGWNKGFQCAKGEYILVLDHDSFPDTSAIGKAVCKFASNESLGLIAFRIVNYYDGSTHQSAEYDEMVSMAEAGSGIPSKRYVGGGALLKAEMIKKIGGYSETLFLYGFEADYAMKALHAGYEVRYFNDIQAFHMVKPFDGVKTGNVIYYTLRNHLWMFWKYSPTVMAFAKSVYLMVTFLIKSLRSGHLHLYFQAIRDGFFRKPPEFKTKLIVPSQTLRFYLKKQVSRLITTIISL